VKSTIADLDSQNGMTLHRPPSRHGGQLIRLLLAFKSKENHPDIGLEKIREYQRDKWGTSTGDTCVIELSGLASPNIRTPQDRKTLLSRRIVRIRQEALRHPPEFIVMYGLGQRDEYEQIAGANFDSSGMCRIGKTVAAITHHPVTRGLGKDYWMRLGSLLRSTVRGSSED
jgi:hypothetical protein